MMLWDVVGWMGIGVGVGVCMGRKGAEMVVQGGKKERAGDRDRDRDRDRDHDIDMDRSRGWIMQGRHRNR